MPFDWENMSKIFDAIINEETNLKNIRLISREPFFLGLKERELLDNFDNKVEIEKLKELFRILSSNEDYQSQVSWLTDNIEDFAEVIIKLLKISFTKT